MKLKYSTLIRFILIILVVLAIWGLTLDFIYPGDNEWIILDSVFGRYLAHILINLGPELGGIAIGALVIDELIEQRRNEAELKNKLIKNMGSHSNEVAVKACEELRFYGWLFDGTLEFAQLSEANLEDSNLSGANLYGANLSSANLCRATLTDSNLNSTTLNNANFNGANLSGARLANTLLTKAVFEDAIMSHVFLHAAIANEVNFIGTDLSEADLSEAKMSFSDFSTANLRGAYLNATILKNSLLVGAHLQGATFKNADLSEANLSWVLHYSKKQLQEAKSLDGAVMPDGRKFQGWANSRMTRQDDFE